MQVGGLSGTRVHQNCKAIAHDRYGIEIVFRGCVPTDYKSGYSSAYNAEVQRELDRRFHTVSLEMIWLEAELLANDGIDLREADIDRR